MTVVEAHPFIDKSIQIRSIHVGEAERIDGIESLLIGNDQNDIGLLGHRILFAVMG